MNLSVAVLGLPLESQFWGGISWTTFRIIEMASRVCPDSNFSIVLYSTPQSKFGIRTIEELVRDRDNVSMRIVPKGSQAIRWCEANADVVWGPSSGILRTKKVPQVFTHHDMRMFTPLRESYTAYLKHKVGLDYAMKEAKVAVMVSETTRKETLVHYKSAVHARKCDIVPWGLPAGFSDADEVEPLRPDYLEGHQFISTIYDPLPQKRMDLLRSIVPLLDEHGWDLLCMGGMRGDDDLIDHPRVHYPGFVDYDLLPRYIRGSALFLFTSEYEGFGLPPFEAMLLDVPVLYNDRCEAIKVVIGDLAYTFASDEDLPRLLAELMASDEKRTDLVPIARRFVDTYDWELAARRYMYLFETAVEYKNKEVDFLTSDPAPASKAIPY